MAEPNENLRKLTDEEKQKITFVINELIYEDLPEEPTKYDVLMYQKVEEFKSIMLQDDTPEAIEALLRSCNEYINDVDNNTFAGFGFIVTFDMWLNKSPCWPVCHNPELDEWEKLKGIKA